MDAEDGFANNYQQLPGEEAYRFHQHLLSAQAPSLG
jgi:hypothetical protein